MATTRIAEQIRRPDQHNPLVPLALGLLSSLARLDRVLARSLPESETPAIRDDRDPVLLAALGLLSLRAWLGRWLDEASPENAVADPIAPDPPTPREWLR